MHLGKQRRDKLLARAQRHDGIAVNNKWQRQTKLDPDLKACLKRGLLKLERRPTTGRKKHGKRQTYAVLVL